MLYLALLMDAGIFTWPLFVVMLSPYVALWYYIIRGRMLNYLKLLLDSRPHVWDMKKTLIEYQELLKNERKNNRDR